jgi:hypothetical protein
MSALLRLAALALLVTGCASLEAPFGGHLQDPRAEVRGCAEWFAKLDAQVSEARVRDAQYPAVAGFPYLRASRLLAALRPLAESSEQAMRALADRLLALDQEARRYEIMNLPAAQLQEKEAIARTRSCGRLLRDLDLAAPASRRELLERASVPDDYSTLSRALGLYALTKYAFASGIRRHEAQTREVFAREPALPAGATLIRYAPHPVAPLSRAQAAGILERSTRNALGIPEPDETDLEDLLAAYAPSFEVPVVADYDRFGALRWGRDGQVGVDGGNLVVYGQAAWTRYRNRVLLQLVYTLWFPERPAAAGSALLAGRLDGVVWRVTLSPDGEPLVYDTMHACGCYHMFFPTPRATPLPAPSDTEEWLFSPQSLPRIAEGERSLLRMASGTHYIERVGVTRGTDSLARYVIWPYGELRSMQPLGPGRAGAFGPDGLIAGSERPERHLFWPTGIASAGAMRQWGRHATAFVGRRHFDDADLIEKRFSLELGGSGR